MRFLEWFIALRYLFSRERRALVSVNTFISVAGVAVGVAVLVVVSGIMDGATELLFGQITNLFPHVQISRIGERGEPAPIDPAIAADLRREPGVAFAEPVLVRPMMIQPKRGIETRKENIQLLALERVGKGTLFEFKK